MHELVSIIIPAYNAESWIGDTVRSALSQTWPKKEIIIVDDGSTDNTFAIAKGFESKHVRVVEQQNKGASAARNKGLSLAQGDYIQWLDADDLLAPDKISHQLERAEGGKDNRILLASSFGTFFFRHQRSTIRPTALWNNLSPVDWLVNMFNGNVYMASHSWLVSRELSNLAGPWDERLVRDIDGEYFCRVVVASEKVQFVREGMSYYRLCNVNSVSKSMTDKACESRVLSLGLSFQRLLSLEESERVRAACITCLQRNLIDFYPERPELVKKLERMAVDLGGQLVTPKLSWKYSWIRAVFGWRLAKRTQLILCKIRWSVIRSVDKVLFLAEKRRSQPQC